MYRLTASLLIVCLLVLSGCTGRKSASSKAYLKERASQSEPAQNNAYTPPSAVDKTQYTTYTKELQMKMQAYAIDYKKVQIYLDQKLILVKNIDSTKADVSSGVFRIINNSSIEEITINAYTPGVIDSIDPDGIWIKFENGNSLRFVPQSAESGEDNFVIAGNNWEEGTCEVLYAKKIYRASCFKCPSIASVHPMIRLSDIDKRDKKTKVLPGIKIN
ncbi:MAG: hypothetical protein K2Q21_10800 [Chitinophagaceae bacterium]|nr:hypothetical protein [Chitinophagaceae bacterium]